MCDYLLRIFLGADVLSQNEFDENLFALTVTFSNVTFSS